MYFLAHYWSKNANYYYSSVFPKFDNVISILDQIQLIFCILEALLRCPRCRRRLFSPENAPLNFRSPPEVSMLPQAPFFAGKFNFEF